TDSALALLAATPAADGITTFRDWSRDASLPARTELFLTLARKAALRADRDWTGRFVQLAREAHAIESARGSHEAIRNKPNSERAQFMMPEILASGWWAYLAEPFSWQSALSRELDPAIVDGWLAGEVRERIQKMTSDSGSPLGEEWLLRRAVWAAAWKGREHTPEAAASWHEYLGSMIPGAFEVAAPPEIGEAWRIADRGSAQERPDGGLQTARARWNEARTNVAATLQPLAGVDADEARLRQLVALVTTDDSGVGSLRRLYLRDDPFEERRRAMLRGLQPADQWGFIAGIDYHDPRRRAGATAPSEWHELFAGVDWQPMAGAGWGLEYRRIEQRVWNDTRLRVDTRIALDDDWIVRGHAAPALDGEHIARLKTGGGVSRRLGDSWFATLNYEWTKFSDLDAHRFAPGLAWRWHPRSTIEAGIDLVHSVPRSGDREWTPIGSVTADWKFSEDFVARLHVELGDRSRANPVRELVGTDQDFGLGFDLRVPVASRWFLVPSWSYERHERFELHTFGLGVVYGR
ncbi:MAG TPA: hypothetical protein DCY13_06280, partial [Verrucomicrobiales bacterium]|nr:hypothetical protein [Verrucomicrobiales bacterium]